MDFYAFNPTNPNIPCILSVNHTDASKQTATVPLTDSVQRLLNLGRIANQPGALVPLLLEQNQESLSLVGSLFEDNLNVCYKEIQHANGTEVVCLNDNEEGDVEENPSTDEEDGFDEDRNVQPKKATKQNCQLCENQWPRFKNGSRKWVHKL